MYFNLISKSSFLLAKLFQKHYQRHYSGICLEVCCCRMRIDKKKRLKCMINFVLKIRCFWAYAENSSLKTTSLSGAGLIRWFGIKILLVLLAPSVLQSILWCNSRDIVHVLGTIYADWLLVVIIQGILSFFTVIHWTFSDGKIVDLSKSVWSLWAQGEWVGDRNLKSIQKLGYVYIFIKTIFMFFKVY